MKTNNWETIYGKNQRRIPEDIRADFPMLHIKSHQKPYTYINNAATSLKPEVVLAAMDDYYRHYGVSIYRGIDNVAYLATEAFEAAREAVKKFIGAQKAEEIVFTRGTTAALNLICLSFGEMVVDQDSEIIVSTVEHHANYVSWQQLAKRKGARLVLAPVDQFGVVTAAALKTVINERTKIVALAEVSNVMGGQNDLKALADIVHSYGAYFVVDGAQGIVHASPQVEASDLDFYAFSAHKLYGPTGVGCLYGRMELLKAMKPIEMGGEMIDVVEEKDTSFRLPPWRFEAGTPMIAEVIGLKAALDYIEQLGQENMQKQVLRLTQYASAALEKFENVIIYNKGNEASGLLSFNIKGVHPHDAATVYDREGIALRAGHHCAQRTMAWLNEPATLRASFAFYNTKEEVERFIETTKKAGEFLDVLF